MGLFDRAASDPMQLEEGYSAENGHSKSFVDVLSAYIGKARLRQYAFYRDVLKGKGWSVDFGECFIQFGADRYPIQLIGSESYRTSTWLWAVENSNSFPDRLIKDAYLFYNSALMENIPELKRPRLALDSLLNGHNIASIASAAHYEKAVYYRCPYEGGAAFVLVKGAPDSVFLPAASSEAITLVTDLIKQLPLNHKILIKNVLMDCCSSVEGSASFLTGYFSDGSALSVTFDLGGRLSNMQMSQRKE
jgi:hypothetical protein